MGRSVAMQLCHCTSIAKTRKLAIANRSCVSNNSEFSEGGGRFKGRSIWNTGGGGCFQKHKIQCGLVFSRGIVFHIQETLVTPLVAAAMAMLPLQA